MTRVVLDASSGGELDADTDGPRIESALRQPTIVWVLRALLPEVGVSRMDDATQPDHRGRALVVAVHARAVLATGHGLADAPTLPVESITQ